MVLVIYSPVLLSYLLVSKVGHSNINRLFLDISMISMRKKSQV